ncbi:Long chain acyl-CoA synthetase 7 peroxisomal [Boothiomyces macroporosus]|uniref:Long-chain-fatty-acid--CoA ligase n=1 Tax=Boothiomyces macroporosus TaxID=261099 RepID=A0AAD5UEE2_9FUNG|nr:Long chain acyl-CoA synthetase 7 peroxisomal [Boothiomyces macroporosus]
MGKQEIKTQVDPYLGVPILAEEAFKTLRVKAVPVTTPANPLETAVYRSTISPNELLTDFPGRSTQQDIFNHTVKHFPNSPFLGTRYPIVKNGVVTWSEYQFKTYKQIDEERTHFGSGLVHLYDQYVVDKAPQWFLGVFSVNREEWMVSDLGAGAYSIPNVALYDTLGAETTEYIINHAEVPILLASVDKIAQLLALSPKCPTLKVIIVMESLFKDQQSPIPIFKSWGAQLGIKVVSWSEVLDLGKKKPLPYRLPTKDDLYCLSYTSGTTGNPKGAMLTHMNIVAGVRGSCASFKMEPTDVHVSYLPLAHIFERLLINTVIACGASAGFFRGDVSLLVEDIGVLRPTIFASVPRLLNRIHDKIIQGANSGSALKAALFNRALDAKLHYLKQDGTLTHSVWDPLVFNKVKTLLGGRVRAIVSGSAPISPNVLNFLRIAVGCHCVEGYGQTESTANTTLMHPFDLKPGHVGSPSPSCEIKLVSVPEMNYHAKDLKGEVWIRGPTVFKGYLKDKEKTADTITPDGWLKTGDICTLDKDGRLFIVDRKKNIFKLAQGEYIAPEKLENVYQKSGFVAQIYVHGDSLQSELVGIVVPDQEYSIGYAIQNGLLPSSTVAPPPPAVGAPPHPLLVQLCQSDKFKEAILKDLTAIGKKEKLRGFEFLKAIHVDSEAFSAENGLLTPTFKLKRPEAANKYRQYIDAMYKKLDEVRPPAKL